MASRCVLLYSVAGGLINLEYRHVGVVAFIVHDVRLSAIPT